MAWEVSGSYYEACNCERSARAGEKETGKGERRRTTPAISPCHGRSIVVTSMVAICRACRQ